MQYTTTKGDITEIPYIVLPLETNGCPPPPASFQPELNPFPHHRTTSTLYKHGRGESSPDVPPLPRQEAPPKITPDVGAMAPNRTHPPLPLTTICNTVPSIAAALNTTSNGVFRSCRSSPSPDCTHINCTLTSGEVVLIDFIPCSSPPFLHLTVTYGQNNTVLSNVSVMESGTVNIGLNNLTVPLNFIVVQHTEYLTMGIQVSDDIMTTPITTPKDLQSPFPLSFRKYNVECTRTGGKRGCYEKRLHFMTTLLIWFI